MVIMLLLLLLGKMRGGGQGRTRASKGKGKGDKGGHNNSCHVVVTAVRQDKVRGQVKGKAMRVGVS